MRFIGSSALIVATLIFYRLRRGVETEQAEASGRWSTRSGSRTSWACSGSSPRASRSSALTARKIPVVLIHGLWANPWSWARMIESLEADPALRDRYQFWTFGYSTGDPIPIRPLLRRDLDEVRQKFDPDGSDTAFDRMVLVGHSMGGLLAKMMVQDSGTRLWQLISDRPVDELAGEPADRELLPPRPDLQATTGGSPRGLHRHATPRQSLDRGGLEHLGSRLVRLPDPLRASTTG